MAVSDAEYLAWLRANNKRRCILYELTYYDIAGESTGTLRFSNFDYDKDTVHWTDIATGAPKFMTKIDLPNPATGDMRIRTRTSWGAIEVLNEGGERDFWREDYAFAGRSVKIYRGDPSWAKSDFRQVFEGRIKNLETTKNSLVFHVAGKEDILNVEIQDNELTAGPNAGDKIPLCFGQCFNVNPACINTSTHEYQLNDGEINGISNARDNGVSISVTNDLANGKFTLTAQPAGTITADVTGAEFSGTYYDTVSALVEQIVTTYTDWVSGDIDSASFGAHDTAFTQTVGVQVKNGSNVLDVIDFLLSSVGSYWYIKRDGKLAIRQFGDPEATTVASFTDDDTLERTLSVVSESEPCWQVTVGYYKNWHPQDGDALAGVYLQPDAYSEANRAKYSTEYLRKSNADSGVKTIWPLAADPPPLVTALADSADAAAEALRLRQLWDSKRSVYRFESILAPGTVELGDTIELDHPRYGFNGGANAVVVGIEESLDSGKIILEIWR